MGTEFSERLSELRRVKGMGQRAVAEDLGISQALLSHYENGIREPRLVFVARACEYYGVSADYMLGMAEASGEPGSEAAGGKKDMMEMAGIAADIYSILEEYGETGAARAVADCAGAGICRLLRILGKSPEYAAAPHTDGATADGLLEAAVKLSEYRISAGISSLPEAFEDAVAAKLRGRREAVKAIGERVNRLVTAMIGGAVLDGTE